MVGGISAVHTSEARSEWDGSARCGEHKGGVNRNKNGKWATTSLGWTLKRVGHRPSWARQWYEATAVDPTWDTALSGGGGVAP